MTAGYDGKINSIVALFATMSESQRTLSELLTGLLFTQRTHHYGGGANAVEFAITTATARTDRMIVAIQNHDIYHTVVWWRKQVSRQLHLISGLMLACCRNDPAVAVNQHGTVPGSDGVIMV